MIKDRIGEIHFTKEGYRIEIIEYKSVTDCSVKFDRGHIIKNREFVEITRGSIKNPYHRSVCGVGYMGEGKYVSSINRKLQKSYTVWHGMLIRCYRPTDKVRGLSYYGICAVDERWHNYQVFAEWYEQNYNLEIMEGWHLDKDILSKGNKVYSPETCCFVPNHINMLLSNRNKKRELPIGVYKKGLKYYAVLSTLKDKSGYLGASESIDECFNMYKKAKENRIAKLTEELKVELGERAYLALINYKVEITD